MLYFQVRPDRVFLAILHEALQRTREELDFAPAYAPTPEDHEEMDERYRALYPELTRFFERRELLEVLDHLLEASQQPTIYEITDYHWLVVHECLEIFCGLHNDAALGSDGQVGPYIIDQIDSDGFTNVCLGILKGQQILFGPNGQIVENGENLMKILVVLSDGDNNYDKSTYSSTYNSPDPLCRPNTSPWNSDPNSLSDNCLAAQTREKELDTKTKTLANELKSQGTEIYVVGFGVCDTNDPDQKPTAEYCSGIGNNDHDDIADRRLLKCIASSTPGTNDHYFEVPNAEDLPDVFGKIAQSIAFRLIK